MVSQHMGKALTEAQRARWVRLMSQCADEAGLPTDPEFRAAFVSYLEWGSRIAVENSSPGAAPPQHMPVPSGRGSPTRPRAPVSPLSPHDPRRLP